AEPARAAAAAGARRRTGAADGDGGAVDAHRADARHGDQGARRAGRDRRRAAAARRARGDEDGDAARLSLRRDGAGRARRGGRRGLRRRRARGIGRMKLERVDVETFVADALPVLLEDEARHNLMIGLALMLRDDQAIYPEHRLWVVRDDGGAVVAAGLRTPPQ